ncbi:hypothetical protein [Terrimonas alba]|uniref:hypothetical protein n=1 Tax=Terrimonas alba TaxID=3349636 RepID=UPI0035F295DC
MVNSALSSGKKLFISLLLFTFAFSLFTTQLRSSPIYNHSKKDTIIVKDGFEKERLSAIWKNALVTRISKEQLDSFSQLRREIVAGEIAWKKLIESKSRYWNSFRDSLAIPFSNLKLPDTIPVLLGLFGSDDGFTYGSQTVCLDLTALQTAYGSASLPENNNRIDRIFAHEYTHLLHKAWKQQHNLSLANFRDSILWECLYEGIGMYRSLNPKWIPIHGELPELSKKSLDNLYPVFVDRLITIEQNSLLTTEEKEQLNKNLSRGNVNQKWGAFPVAIWLSLVADSDDEKLQNWVNKGPVAVIELAKKYLPAELNQKFSAVFK